MDDWWVLGVDPGLRGALVFLSRDQKEMVLYDVPILSVKRGRRMKNELDGRALQDIFDDVRDNPDMSTIAVAYVELVGAMPGQGVSSMFAFGSTYGALKQVVISNEIPLEHVTPQTWRKKLRVRKGKDGARMRASELLPQHSSAWSLKKHHGRAEAALIAYYGLMERGQGT